MAVLAPIPSARAKIAIRVNAGFFKRVRMANRLFWPMPNNTNRVRRSSRKMAGQRPARKNPCHRKPLAEKPRNNAVGRRNRLPHQLQVILRQMNRQDRGGGFRLLLTAKGQAAGARQDPGGMPVSGGTGFSLSTPACGRIFSQLLTLGALTFRMPPGPYPGPITGGFCTYSGPGRNGGFTWNAPALATP